MKEPARILVVGGGYVGMYTALRLQRKLRRGEADITVVEPQPYMTYQPFLPEAAAGAISPRHVVVPLRRVLKKARVVIGEVRSIDHARRAATVSTLAGEEAGDADLEILYDALVLAPGSVSRTLPIPGLAEHGIGFKTVEEAIALRNHVLEQMDIASSTRNAEVRDAALTFVFVGGGYAGVEALGELEDMARYASRYYHNIAPDDMRWILVEASGRILPEVGEEMGRYTVRELRKRNIDVRLETRLVSCEDRVIVLDDGSRFRARTLVWTAGVKAHPVLAAAGLPLNGRGRLVCRATLQVDGGGRRLGRGRRGVGARPDPAGRGLRAERPARRAPGPCPWRQRHRPSARTAPAGVPPLVRGLGRLARAPQGRGAHLRAEDQGLAGVVHAPHLPSEPAPDDQPEGQGGRRVDAGRAVQTRDRVAGIA